MRVKKKTKLSVFLSLLLCLLAVVSLIPFRVSAAQKIIDLDPGYEIPYGSYSTTKMSVDQGAGIAYCAEPYKTTPVAGNHAYELLPENSDLRRALYYLQGGPGYDSIRNTYFAGWSDINIYVIGHLVVSYINDGYSTEEDAFYGAPEDYQVKAMDVAHAIRGMAMPEDDFQAFIITSGTGAQTVVGCWYKQYGWIELQKKSSNPSITDGNANYSLEGATYGIYSGGAQVATLTTNADGYAKSDRLETGAYTVKELQSPYGYALDVEAHNVTVSNETCTTVEVIEIPQNYPVDVLVQKVDRETGEARAQGDASLVNAEFTVKYFDIVSDTDPESDGEKAVRSWIIRTDPEGVARLSQENLVSGDPFYTDTTGNICLPVGTVTIQETKAPKGYNADPEVHTVKLPANSDGAERAKETIESFQTVTVAEQIYRGDLEFLKVADGDLHRLAGVPFTITSVTTGESHTIFTDENGYASTAAAWTKHTANTNAGKSCEDGIWFGTSDADDSMGALPYDTYELEEQRCEANKGLNLLKLDVKITRDKVTVNMGTLTDDRISIASIALDDASGTHTAKPEKKVKIVDTITYTGLKKGQEYKMVGELVDQKTGEVLVGGAGDEVTAETLFTAEKTSGETGVSFTIDATKLEGHELVVFEDLVDMETGEVVAVDEDIHNAAQTVAIGKVATPTPKKEQPETPSQETVGSPKTGDTSGFILWAAVAAVCVGTAAVLGMQARGVFKKNRKEK